MIYLFYNWKFVSLKLITHFTHPPSSSATTILLSASVISALFCSALLSCVQIPHVSGVIWHLPFFDISLFPGLCSVHTHFLPFHLFVLICFPDAPRPPALPRSWAPWCLPASSDFRVMLPSVAHLIFSCSFPLFHYFVLCLRCFVFLSFTFPYFSLRALGSSPHTFISVTPFRTLFW